MRWPRSCSTKTTSASRDGWRSNRMPTKRVGDRRGPLEPAANDLLAEIARAAEAAPFLADLITPDRAVELFGDNADRMRGCILASSGPARRALTAMITGPQARRAALAYERLLQI